MLAQNFPGGTENTTKNSLWIADIRTKIWTRDLLTRRKCHNHTAATFVFVFIILIKCNYSFETAHFEWSWGNLDAKTFEARLLQTFECANIPIWCHNEELYICKNCRLHNSPSWLLFIKWKGDTSWDNCCHGKLNVTMLSRHRKWIFTVLINKHVNIHVGYTPIYAARSRLHSDSACSLCQLYNRIEWV